MSLTVSTDHPGGNGRVLDVDPGTGRVRLEQELRDSTEWWFHWNVSVESAAARTVEVSFADGEVVGPWGPAVSPDGREWRWLGADAATDRESFAYAFDAGERAQFAFAPPYTLADFERFADDRELRTGVLAETGSGREVPVVCIGDGPADVVLACRHHACESTASYVLEGALDALADDPGDLAVRAVPFVDLDGVERGDQGKARAPHDHNRDYATGNGVVDGIEPIYPTVRALMDRLDALDPAAAVDLHCPYRWGDHNDRSFFLLDDPEGPIATLSRALGEATAGEAFEHDPGGDLLRADVDWAVPGVTSFTRYAGQAGAEPAATFEVPYFGVEDNVVTPASARALGRGLAAALCETA